MPFLRRQILWATALFLSGICATSLHADVFREAALAPGKAGFNLEESRHPLRGGADLSISRNLAEAPLDFDDLVLTLQEPLTLGSSAVGYLLPDFDVSLDMIVVVDSTDTLISTLFRKETLSKLIAPLPSDGQAGDPTIPLEPTGDSAFPGSNPPAAVPEPIVLLLMLLGVPAVVLQRPRRARTVAKKPAELP